MIQAFLELRRIHGMFAAAESMLQDHIGKPICMPTCGLCCQHNTPPWMTIEALHAVSVLTGKGRLGQMLSLAEGWLLEKDPRASLYEGMLTGWAKPQLRDEWQALLAGQCPFLDASQLCLLYEVRPLTCQSYGVTRDNAAICPRPLGRGETVTRRAYVGGDTIAGAIRDFRQHCQAKNASWIVSGMAPTMLYRVAEPEKFKHLVMDNRIPSAKLVGTELETSLMWQPQMDALRQGIAPDLVTSMR